MEENEPYGPYIHEDATLKLFPVLAKLKNQEGIWGWPDGSVGRGT